MQDLSDLMPEPTAEELEEQFQSDMHHMMAEEQQTYAGMLQDGTHIALTLPTQWKS